jgi:hypothetical protein
VIFEISKTKSIFYEQNFVTLIPYNQPKNTSKKTIHLNNLKQTTMQKKILTLVFILFVMTMGQAQDICLTDKMQKKATAKNSFQRKTQAKLPSVAVDKFLSSKGFLVNADGKYTGAIYTIPVIVHIIVPDNEAVGAKFNPSDLEIQTWIDNCNKIFDTTFGDIIYPEGTGELGGTVMPFKLVLAKRTKDCQATTGIVRHYASAISLPNYKTFGLNDDNNNGVTADQIRAFAPHWSEMAYFNIYIINGFDGNFNGGSTGFASGADNNNRSYDAFMTYTVATSTSLFNIGILPHEIGHALSLKHTFGDVYDFVASLCPPLETNLNCLAVNDNICDTAPAKPYLKPLPDNTMINPCTGTNYDGIQYNFMSYNSGRKFTPGQRERAVTEFLLHRENLTLSLGATPIATNPGSEKPKNTACTITSPNAFVNGWIGPTLVQLQNINNASPSRQNNEQEFYIDYATQNCVNSSVYTDLSVGQTYTLKVGIVGNSQYINAWIDYDNNGTFESSELVATSGAKITPTNGFYTNTLWSATITPPATAILNIPLRLRVRASYSIEKVCDPTSDGQVEDYTVTLKSSLDTIEQEFVDAKFKIWYSKNENKLIANNAIGDYKIYDALGKLVQEGNNNSKEITLGFDSTGIYVFKNEKNSSKFSR